LGTIEELKGYADFLDAEIRQTKVTFMYALEGVKQTMEATKERVRTTLDDSTDFGMVNPLGVLQRQGQQIDLTCMELITKAKHLRDIRQILDSLEGGE